MAIIIENDDTRYLEWLRLNPKGFVVNLRRKIDSEYAVLLKATCRTINRYPGMEDTPGGFTERDYVKLCGDTIRDCGEVLNSARSKRPYSRKRANSVAHLTICVENTEAVIKTMLHLVGFALTGPCREALVASGKVP